MKYFYNNEFKKIDTKEKAYILGLYYADGFVTYKPEKYSYFSGIKLHIKDLELLDRIKKLFPFFNIIKEENVVVLRCNQRLFCEHLITNGVLTRKSSTNKYKLKFPKIPPSLYSHFIRGYFDGDGSIYFNKNNSANSKGFTFTGNNYRFLKKIQEILWYEKIPMKLYYSKNSKSVIRGKEVIFKNLCFSIRNQNSTTIKIASQYLYKGANLYMVRKHLIFNTWKEKPKRPKCPKCNSIKTQWQIKNKYLICRNCNKYSKIVCPT